MNLPIDKVLVVDSSIHSLELMSHILGDIGVEVIAAGTGKNALLNISMFKPDLIIIDVDMPDMSGFELCKRVKSNPQTKYVLVLLMSTVETRDLRIRAIEVGADDFIEKTFDAYILISKCKSLLRIKHLNDKLKKNYAELEEKNKILEFQLKTARQVQGALIPNINYNDSKLRIFSNYLPALEIGGDFLDMYRINEDCISIVLGDVSGHGISAALITAMMSMMMKNLVHKYYNPDQVLFNLNNQFCKMLENSESPLYVCVFYAIINTKEHRILYSNAGQAFPIFVSSAKKKAFELEAKGTPIGMIEDSNYDFKSLSYQSGDVIIAHTDGLSDTHYKNDPESFVSSLKDLLCEYVSLPDPKEIIDLVLEKFYSVPEGKSFELDDVSIILCKML